MKATRLVIPPLRKLLDKLDIEARKKLSQNFLLDQALLDRIGRLAVQGASPNSVFLEIGPGDESQNVVYEPVFNSQAHLLIMYSQDHNASAGPGGLTRGLLNNGVQNLITIEKDIRFGPLLEDVVTQSSGRLRSVFADAIGVSETDLVTAAVRQQVEASPAPMPASDTVPSITSSAVPMHIVGNLPFAVCSRLLLKWIHLAHSLSPGIPTQPVRLESMTLMFQKEVAQRIVAQPGTKHWTRLSVNSQNLFNAKIGFLVGGKTFHPPAKVDAAVVRFEPRQEPLVQGVSSALLEHVCQTVFATRRKMIRHCMKQLGPMGSEALDISEVDGSLRAEELSWADWQRLCVAFEQTGLASRKRI